MLFRAVVVWLALLVAGCTSSFPYASVSMGHVVSDSVAAEDARDGDIPVWLEAGWKWELNKNVAICAAGLHRSNLDLTPPEYNMDALIGKIEISGK